MFLSGLGTRGPSGRVQRSTSGMRPAAALAYTLLIDILQ